MARKLLMGAAIVGFAIGARAPIFAGIALVVWWLA